MNHFTPLTRMELAKMLVWHRKKSKLSQNALADLAGISRTAVQRLEMGVETIQVDTLHNVLSILNIQASYTSPLINQYIESRNTEQSTKEEMQ